MLRAWLRTISLRTKLLLGTLLMLVPVLPDAMVVPDRRLRGDPNVPMHAI